MRKATISFVMSCLSIRPSVHSVRMERLGFHWTNFHEIWYLSVFRKPVENIQVSLKSHKKNGYFTWRPILHFWSYLAHSFLEWEMFQTKVVEKIKTHFVFNNFFFRKSYRFWDYVGKYSRAGQATDDNAHAYFMLDTEGYNHTLRICNTYRFSTATVDSRTRLNVTFIVQCLPCYYLIRVWNPIGHI